MEENDGQRLNWWDGLVVSLAFGALLLVLLETFVSLSPETSADLLAADRVACGFFLADVLVRWRRAGWSRSYWRTGWLDLLASLPLDQAFRVFQAARIYRLVQLYRAYRRIRTVTRERGLGEVLLALPGIAAVLVLFSTILVLEAERHAPGSTIRDGGDALWWALTTVTTVGYGDTHPVTTEGRFVGGFLMLVGIGLFGSMSALITSRIILPRERADHEEFRREVRDLHEEVRQLRRELGRRERGDR